MSRFFLYFLFESSIPRSCSILRTAQLLSTYSFSIFFCLTSLFTRVLCSVISFAKSFALAKTVEKNSLDFI